MKTGLELITEERVKQISKYGYTGYHDTYYKDKELLRAALAYLNEAINSDGEKDWPFDKQYWKSEDYVSNLKKVGAFVAAELDRLQLNNE